MNDTKQCKWCDTTFSPASGKQKFCSESCKQKNKRKQKIDNLLVEEGLPPTIQASKLPAGEKKLPEDVVDIPPAPKKATGRINPNIDNDIEPFTHYDDGAPLTKTDHIFEKRTPQWHNFSGVTSTRKCMICGDSFDTRLSLLKFCSPDCRDQVMILIADPEKAKK